MSLRVRPRTQSERVQATGCEHPTDQGAHRRAGDADHLVAALVQGMDHAQMGVPTSAPGAEHQVDLHAA